MTSERERNAQEEESERIFLSEELNKVIGRNIVDIIRYLYVLQ